MSTRTDATPPLGSLTEEVKFKTSARNLLRWAAALIVFTTLAVTLWNKQANDVQNLSSSDRNQDQQLTRLQEKVQGLSDEVRDMRYAQQSQTEILQYLARGRQGPLPEAAK